MKAKSSFVFKILKNILTVRNRHNVDCYASQHSSLCEKEQRVFKLDWCRVVIPKSRVVIPR
jgi:hypothetical protein